VLLQSHNAVIYGGGGAIGGAVARVFAREGARVFIAGRTPARLDAVAADIAAAGGTVETAQVDAFDQRAVEEPATRGGAPGPLEQRFTRVERPTAQNRCDPEGR
jgi:NAD(P)-dependent dehydrogenase (short-subunit alcohol dehydrogenase family)